MVKRLITFLLLLIFMLPSWSQKRKIQNRPYIDQQDYELINTGIIRPDGEQWYADVADYSPGFSVGVLGELYLNKYLALRFLPTLHFGGKSVIFRDYSGEGKEEIQNFKSTYLSLPVELKFSAPRFNNYRPYLMTGINPMYDLNVKKGDKLLVKPMDCFLEIGMGCDYYFPFFKFIPEIKFCFGLSNILNKNRNDLTDESLMKFSESVSKISSKMIVLTFYFE